MKKKLNATIICNDKPFVRVFFLTKSSRQSRQSGSSGLSGKKTKNETKKI